MSQHKYKNVRYIYCSRYTRKDGTVMIAKNYGLKAQRFPIYK